MGFCKEAIFCLSYYKEAPTEHARGKLYQWPFRRLVIRWDWTKCHSKSSRTWVRRSGKQAKQNHREVLQLVKEFKIWLFYQFYVHNLCKWVYWYAMMSVEGIFRPNVENKVYHAAGGSPRKWQGNLHLSSYKEMKMTSTYSSLITCTQSQSVDADLRFDCEILCENRNSPLRFTTVALETSLRKFRGNKTWFRASYLKWTMFVYIAWYRI